MNISGHFVLINNHTNNILIPSTIHNLPKRIPTYLPTYMTSSHQRIGMPQLQ